MFENINKSSQKENLCEQVGCPCSISREYWRRKHTHSFHRQEYSKNSVSCHEKLESQKGLLKQDSLPFTFRIVL